MYLKISIIISVRSYAYYNSFAFLYKHNLPSYFFFYLFFPTTLACSHLGNFSDPNLSSSHTAV